MLRNRLFLSLLMSLGFHAGVFIYYDRAPSEGLHIREILVQVEADYVTIREPDKEQIEEVPEEGAESSPSEQQQIRKAFSEVTEGTELPAPVYPPIAKRWGYQGVVLLGIRVAADGSIIEVKLLKSSGYEMLDRSAIDVVRREWELPPPGEEVYLEKEFEYRIE